MTRSVVILGGGPAGGATALELTRAGCEVVLLERQAAPGWKIGETLPPESRIALQRLGHWEQFQAEGHLPCHGIVSVWGDERPIEKDFIFNPYGHGWQLDRARFEAGLLTAAKEAGCDVQLGVGVERIEAIDLGWNILTSRGELRAEWLVDCTGRSGVLCVEARGGYEQLDELVAVFSIAESAQHSDSDARTYVEAHPNGWCYSALMPDRRRIVAFQTDRDLLPEPAPSREWFEAQIDAHSEIGRLLRLHDYAFAAPPRVAPAHSGRFQHCAGRQWLAGGDTALTFDPLSGQGSAKALESARRAALAILEGADYQAFCDQLWSEFLHERREFYGAENRWPSEPFWRRRHL